TNDVVARTEQLHDRIEAAHAAREREPVAPIFQSSDVSFEGFPRRVLSARVLITLVLPEPLLHIGRGQVDGCHDRPGQRLRTLTSVNGSRTKPDGQVVIKNTRHSDTLVLGGARKIAA